MSANSIFFSPTPQATYHHKSYASIDPASQPHLSTHGKAALVTGAGTPGIGAAIAASLVRSGISWLGLLGRREGTLLKTRDAILAENAGNGNKTKIWVAEVDVVDEAAVEKAFGEFEAFARTEGRGEGKGKGGIDILVANAGYLPDLASVVEADSGDWWRGFEVNVKGNFNLLRSFTRHATPKSQTSDGAGAGAVVIHVSSCAMHLPYTWGYSSYRGSKLGATKVFEIFGHEQEEKNGGSGIRVIQIHPGLIGGTGMSAKFGKSAVGLDYDDVSLPADFVVWAVSDEAKFLDGKFVWANWDVEELKAMKDKIEGDENLFTFNLIGWR